MACDMIIGYFADGPWAHQALRRILADNSLRVAFICVRFDHPDPILQEYGVIWRTCLAKSSSSTRTGTNSSPESKASSVVCNCRTAEHWEAALRFSEHIGTAQTDGPYSGFHRYFRVRCTDLR